jgi:adenosylcobyric acid synthase
MTAKAVMVLGTTSAAGKSWLATALCRWYARQGLKVAPFKAQNMSNNARVVPGPDGALGEIGSAQYFQALAARAEPDVRMNPVLLKPESDTGSQVVVLGAVRADLAAVPWRERSERLWPLARDALHALLDENDVVVIEGAGSPAEINLMTSDFVNLRTAREARAACLLVSDIDRGGAFAHLYGTHQLIDAADRALIRGFVLNRFRGDPDLLAPGPQQLQQLTSVPTLAVLPLWRGHGLPEEDGVFDETNGETSTDGGTASTLRVAVIAAPRVSNLDEFQPLRQCAGVQLRWARSAAALHDADWIVAPGSKHTSSDLAWMHETGIAAAIERHAAGGKPVLAVCGGLQMLGETLDDPCGVDGSAAGLGLLPLATRFERDKSLRKTSASFHGVDGAWSALAGVVFDGYEIHHGCTLEALPGTVRAVLFDADGSAVGWQQGSVLGLYVHGLFESPAVMRSLFGADARSLDRVFDGLADFVDRHFVPGSLPSLLNGPLR